MLEGETGELFVLEANAIPGMTETSLLPQAAEAAGISFDELVERLLSNGRVSLESLDGAGKSGT
jgi:D-alanine-D-alanine ligase